MDAKAWDDRYAASELVWSAEPNQFVAQECADLPPGRAVDLAAGEGRNAIWLARRGWRVTAVDFSQVALDKGARLAGDTPVDWVCSDATTWQGEGYDLALIAYLQVTPERRAAAVRNAFDALAPNGTFLLVAHDSSNLTEGSGGPQDPSVLMTAEEVLRDLDGRFFDVLKAGRVQRVIPGDQTAAGAGETPGPDRVAYDVLVRLTRR